MTGRRSRFIGDDRIFKIDRIKFLILPLQIKKNNPAYPVNPIKKYLFDFYLFGNNKKFIGP